MVSKRDISTCGIIACLFFFVFTTASFAVDFEPKACVKNNAGVVLRVGQDGHSDIYNRGNVLLGQTVKIYSGSTTRLLCPNTIWEYVRCEGDDGKKSYWLNDGQTLEVTGTVFAVYTNITDNTCK